MHAVPLLRISPEQLRDLADRWDQHLGDLLHICGDLEGRPELGLAALLREHAELLVDVARPADRSRFRRELRHLRAVADTYRITIPAAAAPRVMAEVAALIDRDLATALPSARGPAPARHPLADGARACSVNRRSGS
jgi:hypothetical protein